MGSTVTHAAVGSGSVSVSRLLGVDTLTEISGLLRMTGAAFRFFNAFRVRVILMLLVATGASYFGMNAGDLLYDFFMTGSTGSVRTVLG